MWGDQVTGLFSSRAGIVAVAGGSIALLTLTCHAQQRVLPPEVAKRASVGADAPTGFYAASFAIPDLYAEAHNDAKGNELYVLSRLFVSANGTSVAQDTAITFTCAMPKQEVKSGGFHANSIFRASKKSETATNKGKEVPVNIVLKGELAQNWYLERGAAKTYCLGQVCVAGESKSFPVAIYGKQVFDRVKAFVGSPPSPLEPAAKLGAIDERRLTIKFVNKVGSVAEFPMFTATLEGWGTFRAIVESEPTEQPAATTADSAGFHVNDVVVTQDRCTMQNGPAVINLPKDVHLRVIALNGDWVGCSLLVDGMEKRGWLKNSQVVKTFPTEDNAVNSFTSGADRKRDDPPWRASTGTDKREQPQLDAQSPVTGEFRDVSFWATDGGRKFEASGGGGILKNSDGAIIAEGGLTSVSGMLAIRGKKGASFMYRPRTESFAQDAWPKEASNSVAHVALTEGSRWKLKDDEFVFILEVQSLNQPRIVPALDKSLARECVLTMAKGTYSCWGYRITVAKAFGTVKIIHGRIESATDATYELASETRNAIAGEPAPIAHPVPAKPDGQSTLADTDLSKYVFADGITIPRNAVGAPQGVWFSDRNYIGSHLSLNLTGTPSSATLEGTGTLCCTRDGRLGSGTGNFKPIRIQTSKQPDQWLRIRSFSIGKDGFLVVRDEADASYTIKITRPVALTGSIEELGKTDLQIPPVPPAFQMKPGAKEDDQNTKTGAAKSVAEEEGRTGEKMKLVAADSAQSTGRNGSTASPISQDSTARVVGDSQTTGEATPFLPWIVAIAGVPPIIIVVYWAIRRASRRSVGRVASAPSPPRSLLRKEGLFPWALAIILALTAAAIAIAIIPGAWDKLHSVRDVAAPPGGNQSTWEEAQRTGTVAGYKTYLANHPDGAYVEMAKRAIAQLEMSELGLDVTIREDGSIFVKNLFPPTRGPRYEFARPQIIHIVDVKNDRFQTSGVVPMIPGESGMSPLSDATGVIWQFDHAGIVFTAQNCRVESAKAGAMLEFEREGVRLWNMKILPPVGIASHTVGIKPAEDIKGVGSQPEADMNSAAPNVVIEGNVKGLGMRTDQVEMNFANFTITEQPGKNVSLVVIEIDERANDIFEIPVDDIVTLPEFQDLKGRHEMLGGLLILSPLHERLDGKSVKLTCVKMAASGKHNTYIVRKIAVAEVVRGSAPTCPPMAEPASLTELVFVQSGAMKYQLLVPRKHVTEVAEHDYDDVAFKLAPRQYKDEQIACAFLQNSANGLTMILKNLGSKKLTLQCGYVSILVDEVPKLPTFVFQMGPYHPFAGGTLQRLENDISIEPGHSDFLFVTGAELISENGKWSMRQELLPSSEAEASRLTGKSVSVLLPLVIGSEKVRKTLQFKIGNVTKESN